MPLSAPSLPQLANRFFNSRQQFLVPVGLHFFINVNGQLLFGQSIFSLNI
jgi:hypothetical protein